RVFVKQVGAAALGASALLHAPGSRRRTSESYAQVPNSVGTESPKLKAPAGACDCHHHIYDAVRFPPKDPGPQSQPVTDRYVQRIVGMDGLRSTSCFNAGSVQRATSSSLPQPMSMTTILHSTGLRDWHRMRKA